jgi:uncharacterized protein (TIGR03382 family)
MGASTEKTPQAWGDLVRGADPGFTGAYPRVQIWQGTADTTVYPANANELVKQWTDVWGIDQAATTSDLISTATRMQYASGSTVAVELYLVTGMGHAIATGNDAMGTCPATSGPYFSDENICSTLRAAAFFGLVSGNGSDSDAGSGDGSGSGFQLGANGNGGCNAGHGGAGWLVIAGAIALAGTRRRRAARRDR